MTCIVAVAQGGKVYMGCDSAAYDSDSTTHFIKSGPKIFTVDDYLIGYSNSFRAGQILQYDFVPPIPDPENLMRTMVTDFVSSIYSAYEKNKFVLDEEKGEFADLIIGVHGKLFTIESDMQVQEYTDNYVAIGSGYQFALGSLYTTKKVKSPTDRIQKALEAASEYTGSVKPPFYHESI
jgi:ATP-dependent protease HslVU (ClpYQ) peptidase subunit